MKADIFIPDGVPFAKAVRRITRLGIGAHQDDLEFMAFHGIAACHANKREWFGGVTCTDGGGSARAGVYAKFTDSRMIAIRRGEQKAAAMAGGYGIMIQLGHPSGAAKSPSDTALKEDLKEILAICRPGIVYTHNLADKHETHVGVAVAALQALRELPKARRPRAVWGCEVWRGLDWLPDEDKVLHDVSAHENLAAALNGVFDSQIAGGKRYDLATLGRRRANATFLASHATDRAEMLSFAMDLTPLVADPSLDMVEYVRGYIRRFETDVVAKLSRRLG